MKYGLEPKIIGHNQLGLSGKQQITMGEGYKSMGCKIDSRRRVYSNQKVGNNFEMESRLPRKRKSYFC